MDDYSEIGSVINGGESSGHNKRRPGRPKTKPTKKRMPKQGVTEAPRKSQNCIELEYDMPLVFKHIFELFKAMSSDTVVFNFTPTRLFLYVTDHTGMNKIVISFDGAKMSRYYFKTAANAPCIFSVSQEHLLNVFKTIDKDCDSVQFHRNSDVSKNAFDVVFVNSLLGTVNQFSIKTLPLEKTPPDVSEFSRDKYPVSFGMTDKNFKRLITSCMISMADVPVQIRGDAKNNNIIFVCGNTQKSVTATSILQKSMHIDLKFSEENQENLSVHIRSEFLKIIANNAVSDNVRIYLGTKMPLLAYSTIDDEAIVLYTYVQLTTA